MNIIWGHKLHAIPKTTRGGTVYFQVCLSSFSGEAVVSLAMFLINSSIVKKRWKIFVYLPHCLPLHLFTGRSVSFQNGFHFCA